MNPAAKTPAEEWAELEARINDLAVRAFRRALAVYERVGKNMPAVEAVMLKEQLNDAARLAADIHEFLKRRIAEPVRPAANGTAAHPAKETR